MGTWKMLKNLWHVPAAQQTLRILNSSLNAAKLPTDLDMKLDVGPLLAISGCKKFLRPKNEL